MKRIFLINPNSGKKLSKSKFSSLKEYFLSHLGDFHYIISENGIDLQEKTREALLDGFDQIIAVGGDGTVNLIVNAFMQDGKPINPNALLVVSNFGTGSDFFKTIAQGQNHFDWKKLVSEYKIKEFDLGKIHYINKDLKERYFINACGIGINSEIVQRKEKLFGMIPRKIEYLIPTLTTIPFYSSFSAHLDLDSQALDSQLLGLTIAKGVYVGAGMKLGGGVEPNDGFFDVTIFKKMNLMAMISHIPRLYSGSFLGSKKVRKFRVKKICVKTKGSIPVEYDGEIYGVTDVEIKNIPKAIRICVPN